MANIYQMDLGPFTDPASGGWDTEARAAQVEASKGAIPVVSAAEQAAINTQRSGLETDIFGTVLKLGGETAKFASDYNKQQAMISARQDFEEARGGFLARGQLAAYQIEGQQEALQASSGFARSPEQDKRFFEIKAEFDRLNNAYKGGMDLKQFVNRVKAVTTQYTTQYPTLAPQIRQMAQEVSGLPGGGDFFERRYVQQLINPPGGGRAAGGVGSSVSKDPLADNIKYIRDVFPQYSPDMIRSMTEDERSTVIRNAAQRHERKGNIADFDARVAQEKPKDLAELDALTNGLILRLGTGIDEKARPILDKVVQNQTILAPLYEALSNKNMSVSAFAAIPQVNALKADIVNVIDREVADRITQLRTAAYKTQTDGVFAISESELSTRIKSIQEQGEALKTRFTGPSSMFGLVLAMSNHEKEGYDVVLRRAQVYGDALRYYPKEHVQTIVTNNPAMLNKLTQDYGAAYVEQIKNILNDNNQTRARLLGLDYNTSDKIVNVSRVLNLAKNGVVSQDVTKPEAATVAANASAAVTEQTVPENARLVEVGFVTDVTQGTRAQEMPVAWQMHKQEIAKLPPEVRQEMTAAVVTASAGTVEAMFQSLQTINNKYGVNLQFVTNDEGVISIANPKEQQAQYVRGGGLSYMMNPNHRRAAAEFMGKYKPVLSTNVFSVAAVTDDTPFTLAYNITNYLNGTPEKQASKVGGGRGTQAGSPGVTNYNYGTGELKRPSIYSGTQAERDAYDAQQRSKMAEGQARLEANEARLAERRGTATQEPVVTPVRQEEAQPSQPISPLGQALERGFEGLAAAGNAAVDAAGNALSNYAERQDRVMTEAVNTVAQRKTQQIQDVVGATSKVSKSALDNVSEVREKGIEYLSAEGAKFLNNIKKQVGTIVEAISNVSVSEPPVNITDGFPLPEGYVPGGTGDTMAAIAKPYMYQGKPFRAWVKPNQELTPQNIMIHHTATDNVRQVINGFSARFKGQDETYGTGSHYLVSKKGEVIGLVDKDTDIVYHVGDEQYPQYKETVTNNNTIGIEIVGADSNNFTPAQIQAVRKLVGQLIQNHGRLEIYAHGEVSENKLPSEGLELTQQLRKEFNQ